MGRSDPRNQAEVVGVMIKLDEKWCGSQHRHQPHIEDADPLRKFECPGLLPQVLDLSMGLLPASKPEPDKSDKVLDFVLFLAGLLSVIAWCGLVVALAAKAAY